MGIYYLLFLILFLADTYFGYFNKEKMTIEQQRTSFTKFAFVALFLLFALRHQSRGIDLGYYSSNSGYINSFDQISKLSWNEILSGVKWLNYEYGYIVFNKLASTIYNNEQFFIGVCAFVGLAPIMSYIGKKSTLPFLSVVIFMGLPVFHLQYSGLRQTIAIAITVFSMKFVEEKKPIRFLLTIYLATLFHYSAFIFIIAYPIYYLRLNDIWKAIFVIFIPFVFFFRGQLYVIFGRLFKENVSVTETGAITLFLVFIAIYIYLIILNKECDENQNGMINLFYIACIMQAFGSVSQVAMRVGYYFMPYLAIAIPNTITKNKDRQEYQANYVFILIAFLVYGIYSIKNSTWSMAYPYYFFWE